MGLQDFFIKKTIEKWLSKQKKENTQMFNFLSQKKTNIILIITGILGAIDALNAAGLNIHIPMVVYTVLAALGLGTNYIGRDALNKQISDLKQQVTNLSAGK